jgi:hypothetical protein
VAGGISFPKFTARVNHFSVISPFVLSEPILFSAPVFATCHIAQSSVVPLGASWRILPLFSFGWQINLLCAFHTDVNNMFFACGVLDIELVAAHTGTSKF